jgi:hypothetical protein
MPSFHKLHNKVNACWEGNAYLLAFSLEATVIISIKWILKDPLWKLSGGMDFGPYPYTVTPTLHEVQIKLNISFSEMSQRTKYM